MPEIMPCGDSTSWMIRTRAKGIMYKCCLACMNRGAGLKKDAYGNIFPDPVKIVLKSKKTRTPEKLVEEVTEKVTKEIEEKKPKGNPLVDATIANLDNL